MAKPHGAIALFDTPEKVLKAALSAKTKGLKSYESYTPFPVHGMEEALGLKQSVVPWATFVYRVDRRRFLRALDRALGT